MIECNGLIETRSEWQAAQKHEVEQQNRANKHWRPLLEKWSAALSSRDKARRAEAEKALTEVSDPRAVPMIWAVFGRRTKRWPVDISLTSFRAPIFA